MSLPRKYMAASVPRFIRQTKLAHLSLNTVIGNWITSGNGGSSMIYDVIMLPIPQFQRMQNYVGLQHMNAPTLVMGPSFSPSFVLTDTKHVTVPPDEPDPEEFAKNYFIKEYNLSKYDKPENKNGAGFFKNAQECTRNKDGFESLIALFLIIPMLLSACVSAPAPSAPPKRVLNIISFSDLPGWQSDSLNEAIPALRRSCEKLSHKASWTKPCAALAALHDDDRSARAYFETWFHPYAVSDNGDKDGLFTGYYEAELHGAAQPHGNYQTPIYARPSDLITVDLGDFKSEWKGKHLTGKVVGQNLKPYDDRTTITQGSLTKRANVLAWVDDPVSAFFLAVQGSGRIALDDGRTLRVGYDGANGRDYVAIGRKLADSGDVPKPVTMQSIRAWLAAHPERANDVMNMNPSYVFFRILDGEGPVGAEGVALTPRRSLAVDPAFIALGSPVWLDTMDGENNSLQRLMIAQDTGGAIKGIVRGDVFWGFGKEAETEAGAMQSRGRYYLLLPKTVKADE